MEMRKETKEVIRKIPLKTKKKLIKDYGWLVVAIANRNKHRCTRLQVEDLIQEGFIGLWLSYLRYDKKRKFVACASVGIKSQINRAISEQEETVRISQNAIAAKRRYEKARRELSVNGEEPTIEQIARRMGSSISFVKVIKSHIERPLSTDAREVGDKNIFDFIPADSETNSVDRAIKKEEYAAICNLMQKYLTPKERRVLRLRLGLGRLRPHGFKEIGEEIGRTKARACQIYHKATHKLKKALRN